MREISIRVRAVDVEPALDQLLLIAATGVREQPADGEHVDLVIRGRDLPSIFSLTSALAGVPHRITERSVSDDWRERRLADYRPEPIGGRLIVRPDWAPPGAEGMIDIVLSESSAFGAGSHPTTRTCLELLLELPAAGCFADLGCGSGVLAILAAKLGWQPVRALDVDPASVAVTRSNAERNGVAIVAAEVDLRAGPPPHADGFAANVPGAIHRVLAAGWARQEVPTAGLISGIGPDEIESVVAAYRSHGLHERQRVEIQGWMVSELHRG